MDTLQCIKTRRSIRKFLDKKIPDSALWQILEAGNLAPSSGNIQNWRFLVVEDEAKKKMIAKAALNQSFIASAPVVVLVFSDTKVVEAKYGDRGKNLYAKQNIANAVENMMLAAWNFGVGSCWVGAFTDTLLRKEFVIPDFAEIHAIIPFGYPAEMPRMPSRLEFADVISFEKFGQTMRGQEVFPLSEQVPKVKKKLAEAVKRGVASVSEKIKKARKKKN